MKPKESPGAQPGASSKSRLTATREENHNPTGEANTKSGIIRKTEPKQGTASRAILDLLRSRRGDWVGVNEFMRHANCAAPHSTISNLRKRYGFQIENRMKKFKNGITHSEYKLEEVKE